MPQLDFVTFLPITANVLVLSGLLFLFFSLLVMLYFYTYRLVGYLVRGAIGYYSGCYQFFLRAATLQRVVIFALYGRLCLTWSNLVRLIS
jgi:hypothetical protein